VVGLNNYRFFLLFLIFTFLGIGSYVITSVTYLRRYTNDHHFPWGLFAMGIIPALCLIPVGGMFLYHMQLSMVNLSTNEHMNLRKYKYFFPSINGIKKYKNPWFKGWLGNFMDRMQPNERCYIIPEEHQNLLYTPREDIA
jgi:hypothetical protein